MTTGYIENNLEIEDIAELLDTAAEAADKALVDEDKVYTVLSMMETISWNLHSIAISNLVIAKRLADTSFDTRRER